MGGGGQLAGGGGRSLDIGQVGGSDGNEDGDGQAMSERSKEIKEEERRRLIGDGEASRKSAAVAD